MASRHVKMVLSGDGGDENFAGYNSYEFVASRLAGAATPASAQGKSRWYRDLARLVYRKAQRATRPLPLVDDLYREHSITAHHFPPGERRKLFKPELRGLVRDVDEQRRALLDVENAPVVTRLQHLDLMAYLPYDILTKVDIAAMANSLEVRVPLLDHLVVELAATMPSELKLKPIAGGYDKKHILKNLARRRYDASLIDRPKMGFGVPIGDWMAGRLRERIEEKLLGSPMLPRFFDMTHVASIWQQHLAQRDGTAKLWNLLFLDEWLRTHEEVLSEG